MPSSSTLILLFMQLELNFTLIFAIWGLVYFFVFKRRVDIWLFAFVGLFYYTLPAYFYLKNFGLLDLRCSILSRPDVVSGALLLLVIFGGVFSEKKRRVHLKTPENAAFFPRGLYLFLFSFFLFYAISIVQYGPLFLLNSKAGDSAAGTGFYGWFSLITLSVGLAYKKKLFSAFGIAILLELFLGGVRSFFVVGALVFIYHLGQKNSIRIICNPLKVFFACISVIIVSAYKLIYVSFVESGFGAGYKKLRDNGDRLLENLFSESWAVFQNLGYSLYDYSSISLDRIISTMSAFVPFLQGFVAENFGILSPRYASYLKQRLAPMSDYGIAATFWGESYFLAGYMGILIAAGVWWYALRAWQNKADSGRGYISKILCPLVIYAAFYIHRLDSAVIAQGVKIVILAIGISVCGSLLSRFPRLVILPKDDRSYKWNSAL